MPDTTWVSCANAIKYVGAKPVFVDIKEDTWCINPFEIEKKITKKTRAIMAVHLYGNVCDMESIIKIKKKNINYILLKIVQNQLVLSIKEDQWVLLEMLPFFLFMEQKL